MTETATSVFPRIIELVGYRESLQPYLDLIKVGLSHSPYNQDNVQEVVRAVDQGRARLVRIVTDDQLEAVLCIEGMLYYGEFTINVWCLAGAGMEGWLDDLMPWLEDYAREHGACKVSLGGRKGWEKALKRFGYETDAVCMSKRV